MRGEYNESFKIRNAIYTPSPLSVAVSIVLSVDGVVVVVRDSGSVWSRWRLLNGPGDGVYAAARPPDVG